MMNKRGIDEVVTYRDCIKDGILVAFIVNTIFAQFIFSSSLIFTFFFILTIISGLIVYTPIVLVIRDQLLI